jgi:hypothetical protein
MRRYGAFQITEDVGPIYESPVESTELEDLEEDSYGRVYTRAEAPVALNVVPVGTPANDSEGRRPVGVRIEGEVLRGFPTPSGKLEFYSSTLASWGWQEFALPTYIKSHVHPENLAADQKVLI